MRVYLIYWGKCKLTHNQTKNRKRPIPRGMKPKGRIHQAIKKLKKPARKQQPIQATPIRVRVTARAWLLFC